MDFSLTGLIISVVLLIPNLLFVIFPAAKSNHIKTNSHFLFEILEKISQAGCISIPIFSGQNFDSRHVDVWFVLMAICILLYYILWLRYFIHDRDFTLLFIPFAFIPIPMAIFPVLAFSFAAIWGGSVLLAFSAVLLAIGHFKISWDTYRLISRNSKR